MTEAEKMLAGKLYDSSDEELFAERTLAHRLCREYNNTIEEDAETRRIILDKLIPHKKNNTYIQGPLYVDYGKNISVGKNFYANFNFTVLDICPVKIGDDVFIGPNVSLVTPIHPLRYQDRNTKFKADGTPFDYEYGKPIEIGDNCWLSSGVTVIGGVHIGSGSVIGAGSVVTRDIPENSLAVGNPCKVIRKITEEDAIDLKTELF